MPILDIEVFPCLKSGEVGGIPDGPLANPTLLSVSMGYAYIFFGESLPLLILYIFLLYTSYSIHFRLREGVIKRALLILCS